MCVENVVGVLVVLCTAVTVVTPCCHLFLAVDSSASLRHGDVYLHACPRLR